MSKAGEIPYTWPEIEAQIKDAILCQASVLEGFGPWLEGSLVAKFLGISEEEFADTAVEDITEIDITRHQLYVTVEHAYRYAYQLDGWWECSSSVWHDVDGLLQGYPQADAHGERSPFCMLNDFPLRRVLETFFARFGLFGSERDIDAMDLSIRELALLSNMTVPAVRTSLSKEGFKLERYHEKNASRPDDRAFRLKAEDAKLWLSRRRGFIPQGVRPTDDGVAQTVSKILSDQDTPFEQRVSGAMSLLDLDAEAVTRHEEIENSWLHELLQGKAAAPKLGSLRALARLFKTDEARFAADGVQHLIELELAQKR